MPLLKNIREKFLRQKKIKNYLLYAIGEIILVVIGILLALQINNLNEHQKNIKAEQQILKDLSQEFQMNQNLLLKKLAEVNKGIEIQETYLKKLATGNYNYKDLTNYQVDIIQGAGTSDPSYGVINSLIGSGDIKLIRNDSLKYELSSWKDKMSDLYENEKFHLDNIFKYSDYTNGLIPKNVDNFNDFPKEKIESLYMKLTKDIRYRNFVTDNAAYLRYQVKPELTTVNTACEKIIQLIADENE